MMRLRAAVAAAVLLVGTAAASSFAHEGADRRPGATRWDLEVKITSTGHGGYAPAVATDRFGNQYAVARKDTEPATADDRSQGPARAATWRWWSADHGVTWDDLPGQPAAVDAAEPGFGSDVTSDEVGNTYVVEDHGGTLSFLHWTATARGVVRFDGALLTRQVGPGTGRPRIVGHGNGRLMVLWPQAQGTLVLVSADGAKTFTPMATLAGQSCTGAAPRGRGGFVIACSGAGELHVYASDTDTGPFTQRALPPFSGTVVGVPAVAVDPAGRVFVAVTHGGAQTRIDMVHSSDGGRTWSGPRRLSDLVGEFVQAELVAAPNGRLGIAAYYREQPDRAWEVVGSVFLALRGPGPLLESFAKHQPVTQPGAAAPTGDRLGAAFDGESRLSIVWTAQNNDLPQDVGSQVARDVWFVRSQLDDPKYGPGFQEERTPTGPLPDCRVPGAITQVGQWQKIRKPAFRVRTAGAPDVLSAYSFSPLDPARMYVTNGTTVLKSEDAGCSWTEVFSFEPQADASGLTSGTARITRIVAPGGRTALRAVWLEVVESSSTTAGRPHVVYSASGKAGTFFARDSGLPPAGVPSELAVSPVNPDFAYLAVTNAGHTQLYATEDATTWQSRGAATDVLQGLAVTDLQLDPFVPNSVWAVADGALLHSTNGGRSWDGPVPSVEQLAAAGRITALDVYHVAGGLARVVAFGAPDNGAKAHTLTSVDNGRTWSVAEARGIEAPVESVAHGSAPDILVVSTAPTDGASPEVYYLHREDGEWDDVSPAGLDVPFRVSADTRAHPTFYGIAPTALWRYGGSLIEPGPPAPLPIGPAFTAPDLAPPTSSFTPRRQTVVLGPGQSKAVRLGLTVNPRPRRVDLYFLVDTSASLSDDVAMLRKSLPRTIATLQADGVDLWAGLGIYKTDSDAPRYQRLLDLGDPARVEAELATVSFTNGGGRETQLIALQQTLTGSGQSSAQAPVGSPCDVDPRAPGCDIAPGQQADFRSGSLRVVVHVTDSPFRNPAGTPRKADGSPDLAGVAREYVKAGVHIIGIEASSPNANEVASLHDDMLTMSRLTRTLAGPGGADCDGDGVLRPRANRYTAEGDIARGGVLVCPSRSSGPAGAVLSLLRAQPSLGLVKTTVVDPTGLTTGGVGTDRVDLAGPKPLSRELVVSCSATDPADRDVVVTSRVDSGPVARSIIAVRCGGLPVPLGPALPPLIPPLLPPNAPPPPPPPAQPAPGTQVQQQVQSQVQAQPQLGAVGQEQERVQLAVQGAGLLPPHEDAVGQLAMSRRSEQERAAKAVLASALLAASVVGAVGYRRRFATTTAAQPVLAD